MAEMCELSGTGGADRPALMARFAHCSIGQEVVRNRRACGCGRVAIGALLLQLQVQLMRKRRLLCIHECGGEKRERKAAAKPQDSLAVVPGAGPRVPPRQ